MFTTLIMVMVHMSKFNELYTLLYVNYTAIMFKNIPKNSWNKLQYIYFNTINS